MSWDYQPKIIPKAFDAGEERPKVRKWERHFGQYICTSCLEKKKPITHWTNKNAAKSLIELFILINFSLILIIFNHNSIARVSPGS